MNTKLGNKKPKSGNSVQWCTDIEAQRVIENREATIKYLTEELRNLKKENAEMRLELENIAPVIKRQQEYIIKANEALAKRTRLVD
jgi:predicted GNAT family acetyltransferase